MKLTVLISEMEFYLTEKTNQDNFNLAEKKKHQQLQAMQLIYASQVDCLSNNVIGIEDN